MKKGNNSPNFVNREGVFGGQLIYAMTRKMEITGVSRHKHNHIGEDVYFHIKHCMPLIEKGVVYD